MDENTNAYENYKTFLDKVQQVLQGGVVDVENTTYTQVSKFGITKVAFKRQLKIIDLAEKLKNELPVKILYLSKTTDSKNWEAAAYSRPYFNKLYIIQMESRSYGITKQMDVIFYDSLDDMFKQINKRYQGLQEGRWELLQVERPEVLFSNFMS